MKLFLFILSLGLALLVTARCNWSGPRSAEIQFALPENSAVRRTDPTDERSRSNPETLGKMHCFFISVSGTGVTPSVGSQQLNTRKPECFGIGATSPGIKLTELTSSQGYRFRIPLGAERQVSVFGAFSSSLGTTCTGKEFGELFGTDTRPRVFLLGRTKTDLFRDSQVNVSNTYDSETAEDLAETCPVDATAKPEPGDPTAPPPLRGARLIIATERDEEKDNLFVTTFDAAGTLSFQQSQYMQGTAKQLRASLDFTRMLTTFVFAFGGRLQIAAQVYRVETQGETAGSLNLKTLGGMTFAPNFFAVDPVASYAFYPNAPTNAKVATFANDTFNEIGTNDVAVIDAKNVVATGKWVYFVTSADNLVTPNTALQSFQRSGATGALTPTNPIAFTAPYNSTYHSPPLWDEGDLIYHAVQGQLFTSRIDQGMGNLIAVSPVITIPSMNAFNQEVVRMQFDDSKTKLYVLTREHTGTGAGPGALFIYGIDASGSLTTLPTKSLKVEGVPTDLAVDPLGALAFIGIRASKTLLYVDLNATNLAVSNGKTFGKEVITMQMIPLR